MAEHNDLDQKREAQRRLALLALTSEHAQPIGTCLKAEELACLVEGRLDADQTEACLAHLAGCEHCYRLWRQLDHDRQQHTGHREKRGRLMQLLHRPRYLATAGSLLAAAASIALFLSITMQTDRQTLMRSSTEPLHELKQTPPAGESSMNRALPAAPSPAPVPQPMEEGTKEKSRSQNLRSAEQEALPPLPQSSLPAQFTVSGETAPAAAGRTAPLVDDKEATDTSMAKKQALADRSTPVAPPQSARQADATTPSLAKQRTGAGQISLDEWHQTIRTGCQGQPDADFFARLEQQGQHLLTKNAFPVLSAEERIQTEKILSLLVDQRRQPAALRCQALLQLLNAESR
jgi:hypothetical protein